MFNLYEIVRSAQGGHALDNLASQFNITPEEADRAVRAIVPELSEGFLKQASEPAALGFFAGSLGADTLSRCRDTSSNLSARFEPCANTCNTSCAGQSRYDTRARGDMPVWW